MTFLSSRTKKVTTYGRKKNAIVDIHRDFSPEKGSPREAAASSSAQTPSKPSRVYVDLSTKRPLKIGNMNGNSSENAYFPTDTPQKSIKNAPRAPLQTKSSFEVARQPLTPKRATPPLKKAPIGKSKLAKQISPPSTDERPRPARYVASKRRVVIPRSPSCSPREGAPSSSKAGAPRPLRKSHAPTPMRSGNAAATRNGLSERLARLSLEAAATASPMKDIKTQADEETTPQSEATSIMIPTTSQPSSTTSLLEVCSFHQPIPFEAVFTCPALTSHLAQQLAPDAMPIVRKIGEASYSEVFGVKASAEDVEMVVKIIPLLDGPPKSSSPVDCDLDVELPDSSEIKEVVREIELTRHMARVPGGGFIEFLGALVVEGVYPEWMLEKWDEYEDENGSQNIRPDAFASSQQYAFLILSDGGADLEHYQFGNSKGWVQAAAVFWQVADALARAEKWTNFEHRDLHEGQVLVAPVDMNDLAPVKNYLDTLETGVQATVIDFGLSRLDLERGPIATHLPTECYDGVGEQWDVYRQMREHIEPSMNDLDRWNDFFPRTNVLWLHYLAQRFLRFTRTLRKPMARRSRASVVKGAAAMKNEVIRKRAETAYAMLTAIETELNAKARRGKTGFASAGEVMAWGRLQGWVA